MAKLEDEEAVEKAGLMAAASVHVPSRVRWCGTMEAQPQSPNGGGQKRGECGGLTSIHGRGKS